MVTATWPVWPTRSVRLNAWGASARCSRLNITKTRPAPTMPVPPPSSEARPESSWKTSVPKRPPTPNIETKPRRSGISDTPAMSRPRWKKSSIPPTMSPMTTVIRRSPPPTSRQITKMALASDIVITAPLPLVSTLQTQASSTPRCWFRDRCSGSRDHLFDRVADFRPGARQRFHLGLSGPPVSADDGARVPHPLARGSRAAADEPDDGLAEVPGDHLVGRHLFIGAADFPDHDDGLRGWIITKQPEHLFERQAQDRVATDTDRGALSHAGLAQPLDDLVGQRPTSGDDAHRAGAVDVVGNDADLGLARGHQARAVRPD